MISFLTSWIKRYAIDSWHDVLITPSIWLPSLPQLQAFGQEEFVDALVLFELAPSHHRIFGKRHQKYSSLHCTLLHYNRGVLDFPLHPESNWTPDGITRWVQHGNQSGDHSKLDVSVVPPWNSLLAQRKKLKWHKEQPKSHVCDARSNSFLSLKSKHQTSAVVVVNELLLQ